MNESSDVLECDFKNYPYSIHTMYVLGKNEIFKILIESKYFCLYSYISFTKTITKDKHMMNHYRDYFPCISKDITISSMYTRDQQ